MKIRLVTVVWGSEYAEIFLRVTLRTLLAEGNGPALAQAHQVIYTIYTTADGAELMEASPAFVRLREQMDIRLSVFAAGEIDGSNHGSHGYFWNREIDLARQSSAVLFFIIPDVLYAEGTLTRWAARFEAGAGTIFTIGPQVALETIIPELEDRFPDRNSAFSISRDHLHELLLRHLHPLHAAMRHDSERRPPHPEYDLRLVPQHGLVIREIVSHPFCINPRVFNEIRHYGPRDHLDTVVYEECLALSVEPLLKRVYSFYRPWPLDEARLTNLAAWWDHYTTEACENESAFPFDICRTTDKAWPVARRKAVAGGRFYRSQILIAGRLYQLFFELRKRQHYKLANLLAFAAYAGRLRRRIGIREGATILVPSERALAANEQRINELLASGREQDFTNLIADHIICSKGEVAKSRRLQHLIRRGDAKLAAGDGAVFTSRGLPGEPLLRDAQRTNSPFSIGPFTVIEIDRVLWRDQPVQSDPAPDATSDMAPATPSLQPSRPLSSGTFVVTAWGRRSNLHRALYYVAYVPFLEPLVAMLLHRIYYPRVMPLIQFEQRVLGFLRRVPYAIWRRVRGVPVVGPILRRLMYVARFSLLLLRKVRSAIRVMRRDGFRQALELTLVRLKLRTSSGTLASTITSTIARTLVAATTHKVSGEHRALMNEVRNVRVMEAVVEVLADYESKMDSSKIKSAPLALLKRTLRDCKLDVSNDGYIEKTLQSLSVSDPEWPEVSLELGFLYEDQGRTDEAMECFAKAMSGLRPSDMPGVDPHPAAVAAARRGALLVKAGNDTEARACFELCLRLNPDHKMIAVEYANVLRRLGHYELALAYYSDGMYYQESRWSVPPGPRDMARLRFPRLTGKMPETQELGFSPAISQETSP